MNSPFFLDGMTMLTPAESAAIIGGGDIRTYVKCVTMTLTRGEGGITTMIWGLGLFGVARMVGVAVGCAS